MTASGVGKLLGGRVVPRWGLALPPPPPAAPVQSALRTKAAYVQLLRPPQLPRGGAVLVGEPAPRLCLLGRRP